VTVTRFDPDALGALEEQRDFLLRSLDDLEREWAAGDIDAYDYAALRDDYTARAAAVLRAIDERRAVAPPRRPIRWGRALVGAVVVLAVAIAAGWAVAASSGERQPGQVVTGGISDAGERDPIVSKLREAERLVGDGEVLEALKKYDEVLAIDADHPAALTYKGWLLVSVGRSTGEDELLTRGVQLLERAIGAHPDYPDAYFFYGFYKWRVGGDTRAAVSAFQRVVANDTSPEPMVAEARDALAALASAS